MHTYSHASSNASQLQSIRERKEDNSRQKAFIKLHHGASLAALSFFVALSFRRRQCLITGSGGVRHAPTAR